MYTWFIVHKTALWGKEKKKKELYLLSSFFGGRNWGPGKSYEEEGPEL